MRINKSMECPHKTMNKILVVRYGKYNIFGFRFGPLVDMKIEVSYRDCGKFVATASQESAIKVWDVKSNRCVATLLGHNTDYECLRVAW